MARPQAVLGSASRDSVQLGHQRGGGAPRAEPPSLIGMDEKNPRGAVGREKGGVDCRCGRFASPFRKGEGEDEGSFRLLMPAKVEPLTSILSPCYEERRNSELSLYLPRFRSSIRRFDLIFRELNRLTETADDQATRLRPDLQTAEFSRILLIKPSALGDVVHTIPSAGKTAFALSACPDRLADHTGECGGRSSSSRALECGSLCATRFLEARTEMARELASSTSKQIRRERTIWWSTCMARCVRLCSRSSAAHGARRV